MNILENPSKSWNRFVYKAFQLLFGQVSFDESQEFYAFQYRLLVSLLAATPFFMGLYMIVSVVTSDALEETYLRIMLAYMAISWVLWWSLRNRSNRFWPVAWIFTVASQLMCVSALLYSPSDELRILWFYINIPGVFIVFGQRTGWIFTLLNSVLLLLINPLSRVPYSSTAIVNGVLTCLYLGVMFHAFLGRTLSFYKRMLAYNLELQKLANQDALTGLMNARAYYEAGDQLMRLSQRSGRPFAVLFVDLDHFKQINDTHGHDAGDEVLRTVAQTLKTRVRGSDLLGRIGGEEFSILLPDTEAVGAMQLGEVLRLAVESCQPQADHLTLHVTASIGVAVSDNAQATLFAIQKQADEAMYQAKQAGRNRVSMLAS